MLVRVHSDKDQHAKNVEATAIPANPPDRLDQMALTLLRGASEVVVGAPNAQPQEASHSILR